MSERTVSANVTVVNAHGMHLRPADLFARTVMRYKSQVVVTFEGQQVDGRSIVELLMLAARQGSQLSISATGEDCDQALAELTKLVEEGFGEMEGEGSTEASPPK
jgi:phosphotransferase system HPr (HPr) family protein